GRVRKLERDLTVEDADRRRIENRREQRHLVEPVLRVLARASAAEEERLQRLRGQVEHALAVDPADPPSLHRVVVRVEHAEPHRSTDSIRSATTRVSPGDVSALTPGMARRATSGVRDRTRRKLPSAGRPSSRESMRAFNWRKTRRAAMSQL